MAKTKAEQMFELKTQYAIDNRDWDMLTEVGMQYEAYLKLIAPIEELPTKELVFVGRDETTIHQEQEYILSGLAERDTPAHLRKSHDGDIPF